MLTFTSFNTSRNWCCFWCCTRKTQKTSKGQTGQNHAVTERLYASDKYYITKIQLWMYNPMEIASHFTVSKEIKQKWPAISHRNTIECIIPWKLPVMSPFILGISRQIHTQQQRQRWGCYLRRMSPLRSISSCSAVNFPIGGDVKVAEGTVYVSLVKIASGSLWYCIYRCIYR